MGITNTNKFLSTDRIDCGDSFSVTLALTAEPDISSNPTDIVLILDRSGSMTGSALANLKEGAKAFIDIIDESTDGAQDGQIGGGSRIGIVSFSNTATQDTGLITSVSDLKAAVDALDADGQTNHADAFIKASQLFDPTSTNARVMVMFTDGETTAGPDPSPFAAAARAAGTIIYAIGLSGSDGVDADALEDWASKPASAYVAITPDDAELVELFENLARNISNPGATDIIIDETLDDCFRILSLSAPTKGTATMTGTNTLRWTIDELGVTASEGASLTFQAEHTGTCTGTVEVNESVDYSDNEGNIVVFPSPELTVECGDDVFPEECPVAVDLTLDSCEDTVVFDAGELSLQSQGRILQTDVTLLNVCPNRRVALAVSVTEVDENGLEYPRGLKTVTIPAHTRTTCRDVTVRCIKFILPEDLDVSGADPTSMCSQRSFRIRAFAHYIDHSFACCDQVQ